MNYKLIKELKDVGFPLKESRVEYCACDRPIIVIGNKDYFPPSLSELIEACGEDFTYLQKLQYNYTNYKWGATSKSVFNEEMLFKGDTPEEAVANLWLELNKKPNE